MATPGGGHGFLPPQIQIHENNDRSALRKIGRKFLCSFENCDFVAYRYSKWDQHFSTKHHCVTCKRAYPSLDNHPCQQPQSGRGLPVHHSLLPANFDHSIFQLESSVHDDTILQWKYTYTKPIGTVEIAFESIATQLKKLINDLINIYQGLRVQINLNVTMEHMTTGRIKTQLFVSPFVRYLYASEWSTYTNILTSAGYITASLNVFASLGKLKILQ